MTVVTPRAGFDPRYYDRHDPEKAPGGYYLNAAIKGEVAGRWLGRGAEWLGFEHLQKVESEPYLKVYEQVDPRTGEKLGRAPGGYRKFQEILDAMLAAEPWATESRKLDIEREAAKACRRSPAYTDMTAGHAKSISVFHAAMREKARRAHMRGDLREEAIWRARELRCQEILQEANAAALAHLEEWAGFTRTYATASREIDGVQTGRWERCAMVITTWLQGTNRDGEPHDHSHNVVARMGRTDRDGEWRAIDTMALRAQTGSMAAIIDGRVRSAFSREYGLEWVKREDGRGYEIKGIGPSVIEKYSKRTHSVGVAERRLAKQWEVKFGREPNAREMLFIHDKAQRITKSRKPEQEIDWDKLAEEWDAEYGNQLADLADLACFDRKAPEMAEVDRLVQDLTIADALVQVQAEHSSWTRSDLARAIGWNMGPEYDVLHPAERQRLTFQLTDETLGDIRHGVEHLEAPEWPPAPPQLMRHGLDQRSVFYRPGTARYATRGQLDMEERMVQQARRMGAPRLSREDCARLLGSTPEELEHALRDRANHATTQTTRTGLRLDQAAVIYECHTSGRRVSVGVGPAGSGKTYTVAAGAKAWQEMGGHVFGVTCSQAARNVLVRAGVKASYNSSQFLTKLAKGKLSIPKGSLIIIDEASMMSNEHTAAVISIAEKRESKVQVVGDHMQLAAPGSGGAMTLVASRLGFSQLAVPVRFRAAWERDASLRLRMGDEQALEAYLTHGRITGAERAEMFGQARRAYVAGRLAGEDTLLMAYTREDCRELSRQIRDDLVHLGLVDGSTEVRLSHGARASVGDLIVARKNDHVLITDREGGEPHELANGDIFRIERVLPTGVLVRRMLEAADDGTPRFAEEPVRYSNRKLARSTDLAYAVTGHNGQGATVNRGMAIFTGIETREWLYVAMTRGRWSNIALVQRIARKADPNPKTRSDPELARAEAVERERLGLPSLELSPEEQAARSLDEREPVAIMAEALSREDAEHSAAEYQRLALANADHTGVLGSRWDELANTADRERFTALYMDALPDGFKAAPTKAQTWLWRSLRQAESAGLDAGEVLRAAINSRPLGGLEDVTKGVYARVCKITDGLTPLPLAPWTQRVPEMGDAELQQYMQRMAVSLEGRQERLGEHAAAIQPPWALEALGPVPDEALARLDWEQRAGVMASYRERYGVNGDAEIIGRDPGEHNPGQRAQWFEAFRARHHAEGLDFSKLPTETLLNMRKSYQIETGWAPPSVARHLQAVRLSMNEARQQATRSDAEAEISAGEVRARHEANAASARALHDAYAGLEAKLGPVQEDRDLYDKLDEASQQIAIQADAELRKRDPKRKLPPMRSAEPKVPREAIDPYQQPAWVDELPQHQARFREEYERRQGLQVPDENPEYAAQGDAYPIWREQKEAILQPPKPEITAAEPVAELQRELDRNREIE
jgi:conjugative relaxase-like TrwC/TraI family protein